MGLAWHKSLHPEMEPISKTTRDTLEMDRLEPDARSRLVRSILTGDIMVTIFGFISERFTSSVLVSVLSEDGTLITKFEAYTPAKAKQFFSNEFAHRSYKFHYPNGYQLSWVESPDNSPDILSAKTEYERRWGAKFYGKAIEQRA